MKRINIELPIKLHTFCKTEASKRGITLKQYIIASLSPKPAKN